MLRVRTWGSPTVCALLTMAMADTEAGAQERFTIADVSFLSGCWVGGTSTVDMEEQWTSSSGDVMLGTTRYLRDGAVVDWEFGRIVADDGGVTLWPYPRGTISEHGFPLVRAVEEYVFENLEHDFPVRIVYVPSGRDTVDVRIEGHDGQGPGWSLRRSDCP